MNVSDFIDRLRSFGDAIAIINDADEYRSCDQACDATTYAELLSGCEKKWRHFNLSFALDCGGVVWWENEGCCADLIASMLADIQNNLVTSFDQRIDAGALKHHPHVAELRRRNHPGLILATSGTTGKPKAVVHDLLALIRQACDRPGKAYRTLMMLEADHIGGINTILYTLAHGGCLIVPSDKNPWSVADVIERFHVELLPTTPSFLRLLLASGEHRKHDMSSLKVISYGAEMMPQATLDRLAEEFPGVKLKQTYGMSEIGILRTKSMGNSERWVQIHTPYRVVGPLEVVTPEGGTETIERVTIRTSSGRGFLEVKAPTAMLGYIGAPDPFLADGWMPTGDEVEVKRVDGVEWVRFIGRKSDTINVGGLKVCPTEVEEVICQVHGVVDAAVYAEPNDLMGEVVCAKVLLGDNTGVDFWGPAGPIAIKRHCREVLDKYKVPRKIEFTDKPLHDERGKKRRGK